jgi:hypothetical protein
MPEQPALLNTPFRFPKFNPGVTLTSAPYVPTAQVIGDPANVVQQLDFAKLLAPPPPPPAAIAAAGKRIGGPMDPYFVDNYGRGGPGRGGNYSTSTGMSQGGWGRTSTGMRSSATQGSARGRNSGVGGLY